MEENVTNSNIGDTNGSHPLQCTKFPEFQEHLDICQEEGVIHCSNPEYYGTLYGLVGTVFQSLIFLVGVLGNLMVVITVRGTKSLHTTTNCYLVSLALADLITLVSSVPQEILSYHILGDMWLWGSAGCSLIIYCQFLAMNASALLVSAFTVERYIAICHPMKAQYICTLTRARRIIICCWIFALFYSSPWLLLTHIKFSCIKGFGMVPKCDFRLSRDSTMYIAMFFTDITLFYLIPLVLSVVLYTLIAIMLLFTAPRTFNDGTVRNQARLQVVKMLIVVVTIFALLWLPHRGMLVFNTIAALNSTPLYMDLWFLMFAKTCIYINSAINPILYNALSTKFRRAFKRTLQCHGGVEGVVGGPQPTPSLTYLANTRLSTVSMLQSLHLQHSDSLQSHRPSSASIISSDGSIATFVRNNSRPYVEKNGLLAVKPETDLDNVRCSRYPAHDIVTTVL